MAKLGSAAWPVTPCLEAMPHPDWPVSATALLVIKQCQPANSPHQRAPGALNYSARGQAARVVQVVPGMANRWYSLMENGQVSQ